MTLQNLNDMTQLVDLGSTRTDASGTFVNDTPPPVSHFHFGYGEFPVHGEIRRDVSPAELHINVDVGVLPFTAQSSESRQNLLNVIRQVCSAGRKSGTTAVISSNHIISLHRKGTLPSPLSACQLVTGLVQLLIEVQPELHVMADHIPGLTEAVARTIPITAPN